jgi:hypothetical protein
VDGQTVYYIQQRRGEAVFLAELRADLKACRFRPLPVRERLIPKPGGGKLRMLDPHGAGSRGASRAEAGAGADLRGGPPAVLVRLSPWPPRPGRHR